MKPESKKVTVEWKYPSRRERKRSTFIGVGRLGREGVGRLGLRARLLPCVTRITLCYRMRTLTSKAVMIVNTTRVAFLIPVKTETVTPGAKIQLRFKR